MIQQLIDRLNDVFTGSPWYGSALWPVLESSTQWNPNAKIGKSNSMGQVLAHMIAWRTYVIEKIKGNDAFEITLSSEQDWPKEQDYTLVVYLQMLNQFRNTQEELIQLLQQQEEEWLQIAVPGREYNFHFLIEGIIQHDIYHLGQISLLRHA